MKTKLMAALAIGALMLAGCGGGGDGPATDTGMVDPAGTPLSFVDVVQGDIVEPGTYHLAGASDAFLAALEAVVVPANGYAPDSMITVGGVSFRCTADNTSNCNIAVHEDGSFTTVGTIAAVLRGGTFPTTTAEQLILAERARVEAERDRADAAQARADAEQARADAAEAARAREEAARQAAEDRLNQSTEEQQAAGFGTSAGTLIVTPRRTASTNQVVISTPDLGTLTATAVSGFTGWFGPAVTTQSDGTSRDTALVYTNIEQPAAVPFRDSTYNAGRRVFDAQHEFVAGYPVRGARADVGGTGFPPSSAPPQSFMLVDRGYDSQAQMDAATRACAGDTTCESAVTDLGLRNKDDFPLRYSVNAITSATLGAVGGEGGAGGTFNCASSSSTTACTVQRRGTDQLFFTGPWTFRPTASDTTVSVADANFMWFGWWAREQIATKEWSYAVGHGPAGSRVSSVSAVSGTATYDGRAIGRFAIDDPLDDEDVVGAFAATATLRADFNENTLAGDLTGFTGGANFPDQGDDPWTVHLRKGSISGGSVSGTSAWSIGADNVDEGGSWSANFYSNHPANERSGVVPYGVAGTFTAEHSGAANMIGAFGACSPAGC